MYLCTGEADIASATIVHCRMNVLEELECDLQSLTRMLLRWAHVCDLVPTYATDAMCTVINSPLPFWRVGNNHVIHQGPMEPIRLFRHGLLVVYSKTKRGVDGASQFRATLNSPGGRAGWEEKMVTQVIQTLMISGFTIWRMMECEPYIRSKE